MSNLKIAVVGQGVIGLTSAIRLAEKGYSVDIFSKEKFTETTSMSAGAYWWPHKTYPEDRVSQWSKATFEQYKLDATKTNSGVSFQEHYRYCLDPDDSKYVLNLVEEWKEIDGCDFGIPCHEAFKVVVPVINVPVYMPRLKAQADKLGIGFFEKHIESPSQLFSEYSLVINCTGVDARHFAKDEEVYPIRGQVVRLSLPKGLKASSRIYQKEDKFTLVLPRENDLVLGGTAQEGDWSREPQERDAKTIIERCSKLNPDIKKCEILGSGVGLRPGRKEVRLEIETIGQNKKIIHNYGHGGGGFTVAWGCADEVLKLANQEQ